MSYIVRGITKQKDARVFCVDAKDVVQEAQNIHKGSATAIVALGRLLSAGLMMGIDLKDEKSVLTLKIEGTGPIKNIFVTTNNKGEIKGDISNPFADPEPLKPGKLNVAAAIGKGHLKVIKDLGLKEPYVGVVPLATGEIGEDLANYFYSSEQIPSVVGLGVLVNPDYSIKVAGGFIIQLLPDAKEEFIVKLEERIKTIKPVTQMLSEGLSPEELLKEILKGVDELEILEKKEVKYVCDCNKDKFYKALITMGKDELLKMFREEEKLEAVCHFCKKKYNYREEDFDSFFNKK